jgi:hypothetical protein
MNAPNIRVLEAGMATIADVGAEALHKNGRGWFAPSAYAFVNIEVRGRGISTGKSCLPLLHDWATPSGLKALREVAENYVSFRVWDTAFGHHGRQGGQPGQGQLGNRLMDAAILDALLRAVGYNLFEGMKRQIAGTDSIYVAKAHRPSWQSYDGTQDRLVFARQNSGRFTSRQPQLGTNTVILSRDTDPRSETGTDIFMQPLTHMQQHALAILAKTAGGDEVDGAFADIIFGPGFASHGLSTPFDIRWL